MNERETQEVYNLAVQMRDIKTVNRALVAALERWIAFSDHNPSSDEQDLIDLSRAALAQAKGER